ncbi:unnamed protein product [Mytilus coruscus]|uniref:Reverse transcriptase domain-containing protein n=1 Tax=Mytilus coruscus TaxID=42192 RepID=A0A6J8BH19_MYTCO|nr:unnamed protein product [Mytilus coruscus]
MPARTQVKTLATELFSVDFTERCEAELAQARKINSGNFHKIKCKISHVVDVVDTAERTEQYINSLPNAENQSKETQNEIEQMADKQETTRILRPYKFPNFKPTPRGPLLSAFIENVNSTPCNLEMDDKTVNNGALAAIKTKSSLYVALMDARKAFDIVWHLGLMREMHKFGLMRDNWLFLKKWYENLKSKIKWKGLLSNSIEERQGVRQGGIWSPTAYKIIVNSLLQTFERNQLGACIGPIYCGIPTVADDVALISTDPYELQTMLNVQADHVNKLRYLLSEQKSTILVYNDKLPKSWSLNGKLVTLSESAVHLGIDRNITKNTGVKEVVNKRITTARKTVYSLMGAGLHGLNGVNPKVSVHLIKIYVIPRLLCGSDVISLSNTDIQKMELFFRQLLDLPKRTSIAATLLLLGRIRIEGEIHKKILKTFGNIIRNVKSVEREIAFRQLAMKDEKSGSLFSKLHNLTEIYGLPSPYDIIEKKYQRSRFSKNCISANCPLCNIEPEDVTHFILKCEKLSSIRNRFIQELKSFLVDSNKRSLLIQELFDDEENLLHLTIDCTTYHFQFKEQVRIETLTRGLCYKLYHKRLLLMSRVNLFSV